MITDLQKPSKNKTIEIVMPDELLDLDDIDVASDSDTVNYKRALAQQNKEIIILKA